MENTGNYYFTLLKSKLFVRTICLITFESISYLIWTTLLLCLYLFDLLRWPQESFVDEFFLRTRFLIVELIYFGLPRLIGIVIISRYFDSLRNEYLKTSLSSYLLFCLVLPQIVLRTILMIVFNDLVYFDNQAGITNFVSPIITLASIFSLEVIHARLSRK